MRAVLQLFDNRFDTLTSQSLLLSHRQSWNKTVAVEQKSPRMQLSSAEMVDRFKKIVVTSVNFVLFSGQWLAVIRTENVSNLAFIFQMVGTVA